MNYPDPLSIRIGTMAGKGQNTASYIASILPHGFESFQINFWQTLDGVNLKTLSRQVQDAIGENDATISSLAMFGNPLESDELDKTTLDGWKKCIDHAHLFGCSLVAGFTGRLRGKSIPESIPRFKKVFGDLAKRAADKGVRIAFENCPMGGNWHQGDWNIAHNPSAWELMFDALPDKNLGLEWEPCHQLCQLIDPLPQLDTWTPKIFHVHGKCASVYRHVIRDKGIGGPEDFCHHRHPGFGDCNWTDIISQLRRRGFHGAIDIEGWHDPVYAGDLEMTGQVHALNYLKRCRGGDFVLNPKG